MTTAIISAAIFGDKLYQQRARAALPILVRQAKARNPLLYSDLAQELAMPNPRNLNFVLGSIGQTLEQLSRQWDLKIPPLQALVINKSSGLPGDGIGWFLIKDEHYAALPLSQKKERVKAELRHVFSFARWDEVLNTLGLEPVDSDFSPAVQLASLMRGGGESDAHKALKNYVAGHPARVGLSVATLPGQVEVRLPSGDSLDVSFQTKSAWTAVEVKSMKSPLADITRGLFQCVKYRAVMEATLTAQAQIKDVRAMLVLEARFPESLLALKNLLGVEVIDRIGPATGRKK